MPEFNQAFIKAYQTRPRSAASDAPEGSPASGAAPTPHLDLAPQAPIEAVSTTLPTLPTPAQATPSSPQATRQPVFRLESAASVPAPHLRFPLVGGSGKKRPDGEIAPAPVETPASAAPPAASGLSPVAIPAPLPFDLPSPWAAPQAVVEALATSVTQPPLNMTTWDELLASSPLTSLVETAPATPALPTPAPAPTHKPLSEFSAPPKVEAFRPALEVPYFLWPEICRTIVAERGEHLAGLWAALSKLGDGARIAITSRERGEGRTTLVASLAAYLAQQRTTCCLIDADFARPQLARRLGVQPQVGWEEVLTGQVPLTEALVESERDRCALLPLANPQPADVQLLSKLEAAVDLGVLGEYYSLVLIDAGPWEGLSALALQSLCRQGAIDALLIVADRRRPADDLATLADDLQATGVGMVGIVENFTSASAATAR